MKRFLIADDHSMIRSGVRKLLESLFADVVIDEVIEGDGISRKLNDHTYDLLVMDVQMPNTDAFGLIQNIHSNYLSLPILVFSMTPEEVHGVRALKAGASGFVSKEASLDELREAVLLLLKNKKYVSPAVAQLLADQSMFDNKKTPFSRLSDMEFKITHLLLEGKTLSEIANALNIQLSTASTYKTRTFRKLNISNLIELKELSMVYKF